MAKGGARPGAGRPKGSKYLDLRAELEKRDPEALDTFIEFLLANYMEDTKLMIWVGEHLFGKPQQNVDVTTNGKDLPQPILNVLDNNSDKESRETQ
jgi:hypothetical protein